MHTARALIHKAMQIELHQIRHLAMLASMAPDELTREIILEMILEETGEAMFWNTVDAAYRGAVWPGVVPYPGAPVYGPGPSFFPPAGPEATLPPTVPAGGAGTFPGTVPGILPGIPFAEQVKKKEEK